MASSRWSIRACQTLAFIGELSVQRFKILTKALPLDFVRLEPGFVLSAHFLKRVLPNLVPVLLNLSLELLHLACKLRALGVPLRLAGGEFLLPVFG